MAYEECGSGSGGSVCSCRACAHRESNENTTALDGAVGVRNGHRTNMAVGLQQVQWATGDDAFCKNTWR